MAMKSLTSLVAAVTLSLISYGSFAQSFTAITSTLYSAVTTVALSSDASGNATDIRLINRAYLPVALNR